MEPTITASEYIEHCTTPPAVGNPLGQKVRVTGYGYGFTREMVGKTGVIERVTRTGNPVIHLPLPNDTRRFVELTDKHGLTAIIDNDGNYIRTLD